MTREMHYLPMTALERQYLARKPKKESDVTWIIIVLGVVITLIDFALFTPETSAHEPVVVCGDSCICSNLDRYDTKGMEDAIADYCAKYAGL